MDGFEDFQENVDDPPVVNQGNEANPANANGPTGAESTSPAPAPPTVVNINLFGTVNRNAAELLRDIMGTNGGVIPSPPLGAAGPIRHPGTPRLNPWEALQGRVIPTPPALRGRGRPPGPQTIMNRMMAAAVAANTGVGTPSGPSRPQPSFLAAPPAPASNNNRDCIVCGVLGTGAIPCGHLICGVCVDRVNNICPSPMCTASFTRAQYLVFRTN